MPVYYDKARKAYRFEFRRVIDGREYKYKKRLPKDWTRAPLRKSSVMEGLCLTWEPY